MLKENEFIIVESYECDVIEDDYVKGETGDLINIWSNKEFPIKDKFKTVNEALQKVCEINNYKFSPKGWMNWDDEFDDAEPKNFNRFDTDVTVNSDMSEVNGNDTDILEQWRNRKIKLYNCHIIVLLKVISERNLNKDEITIDMD